MSLLIDTSVIIPDLGSVAYDRFVWVRLVREQVYVSSVEGAYAGTIHAEGQS